MSKPKRSGSIAPRPNGFEVPKNPVDFVKPIVKQEIQSPQNINFANAMQGIQMSLAKELLNEANEKIVSYSSEIHGLVLKISDVSPLPSSQKLIEIIDTLIAIKTKIMEILSWTATIANIANYLVNSLDVQTPEELLDSITIAIESLISMVDTVLNEIPEISFFGISLKPDQRQISETKSLISATHAKIDKIKQEIADGYTDWGNAEQLALERLFDDNSDFVSGEEMFDWIERLEAGEDV